MRCAGQTRYLPRCSVTDDESDASGGEDGWSEREMGGQGQFRADGIACVIALAGWMDCCCAAGNRA